MPSTDRRLELKAKDIDGSDRLTAGCVLIDLASPGVSQTSVYAKGLKCTTIYILMHKITNDEINITKDIKIKDIQCNKVVTNTVEFNLTISHSIKYSENICWFWYGNFQVILRGSV